MQGTGASRSPLPGLRIPEKHQDEYARHPEVNSHFSYRFKTYNTATRIKPD